jgi:hypothetical protein
MARSSRSSVIAWASLGLALLAGASASAHRRDEYLQAARLAIAPDRVEIELDLTPGISVAAGVLAAIDADGNGAVSPAEAEAHVGQVQRAIALEIDGRPLQPRVLDSAFPPVEAIRNGEGTIRVRLSAVLPELAPGPHRLRYANTHRTDIGVYLANALVPEDDRVAVTGQDRDGEQRRLSVGFELRGGTTRHAKRWALLAFAAALGVLLGTRRQRP